MAVYVGFIMHCESPLLPWAHDWHPLDAGFDGHADVPLGGLKAPAIQLTPRPPIERTSISESFSSLKTTTRTSESGRRKSWRSWRMVVSTPFQLPWEKPFESLVVLMLWYGSGWTRNRYQLSSCDSMPHPNTPVPPTRSVKSVTNVVGFVMTSPLPGVLPVFGPGGNQ